MDGQSAAEILPPESEDERHARLTALEHAARGEKGWSDNRRAYAIALWKDGCSAADIARRLGNVSRNAVIGLVYRMGGDKRRKARHYPARTRKNVFVLDFGNKRNRTPPTRLPAFAEEPFVIAADELIIPHKDRRTVETIEQGECRWPIGDPLKADFHFCSRKKVMGKPYCGFHLRKAYQAPQPKRVSASQPEAQPCGTTCGTNTQSSPSSSPC